MGELVDPRQLLLLKRKRAILRARRDLIYFTEFMMPDPEHHEDPDFSIYKPQRFHRVIGAALEEIESGNYRRLIINIGPRFGKTTLASSMFPAWYIGRHPNKYIICATYNEKYAWDLGRKVLDIVNLPRFRQVFPNVEIKRASVDRIETSKGGVVFFVGRGSSITGRGGDILLLDDPIKDRKEADSQLIRDNLWSWYNQVLKSRAMTKRAGMVLIQTRWTEDDLVGRLTDPMNPYFVEEEAKLWRKIELPALAEDDDVLGRKPGEALWPERFDEEYLKEIQITDPRGFAALYQCRPAPRDGAFFRATDIVPYMRMTDMPPKERMRFYGASDHAVSLEQSADKTCLMVVGVDEADNIWIMPDLVWGRYDARAAIEAMTELFKRYKPQTWWSEKGQIDKSLGPFLRTRMRERQTHCSLETIAPASDKQQRAQAIQARSAMGMVRFPQWTRWWPEAHDQILKFPYGPHDDFVDTLALIGLGLARLRPRQKQKAVEVPTEGTFRAMFAETRRKEQTDRMQRSLRGWL